LTNFELPSGTHLVQTGGTLLVISDNLNLPMPKLQNFFPFGLTPNRKPKKPKLVSKPFLEKVVLTGPKFFILPMPSHYPS